MVDAYRPFSPAYGELLLRFTNERPLLAADLGGLFEAIAKDYSRINKGRKLAVSRLGEGSVWTILQDAAGLAAGADSIVKFGETVADVWKRLQGKGPALTSRTAGFRTVENLVKTAGQCGAAVDFEYKKSAFKGEEVRLRITPTEAIALDATLSKSGRGQKSRSTQTVAPADHFEISRLVNLGSDEELSTIAKFLISSGSADLVEELAAQLESDGHSRAARLFRREAARAERASPPRLLE